MPKWVDRTGKKVGSLTPVEYLGHRMWRCICDCGNECVRNGGHLTENSSCGCQRPRVDKENGIKRTVHGDSRSKLYKRWTGMLQRCENPNSTAYKNYGGRGVSVCDEWHDYATFKNWALESGYDAGLSIDRIDVDGDYEPGNCRWVNSSAQLSNRRRYVRRASWKAIEAIDADGRAIKRFDSVNDAICWLGDKTTKGTGISHVLNGRQSTAYGYGWRYADAET